MNGARDTSPSVLRSPLLPWGLAACFALAIVFSVLRVIALRSENDALRTELELARVAHQMAQTQLSERTILAERLIADLGAKLQRTEDLRRLRVTALASPLGNLRETKAIVVWDAERQSGLLTVEKLPSVAAEQDYQIWAVDPQHPARVSCGVFKPDSTGRATFAFKPAKPVEKITAFAVSLEKRDGAPQAEGPIVLLGRQ